jgi:hypothetical protein
LLDKQSVRISPAVGTFASDSPGCPQQSLQNQQRQDRGEPFGWAIGRIGQERNVKVTFGLNRPTFGLCGFS